MEKTASVKTDPNGTATLRQHRPTIQQSTSQDALFTAFLSQPAIDNDSKADPAPKEATKKDDNIAASPTSRGPKAKAADKNDDAPTRPMRTARKDSKASVEDDKNDQQAQADAAVEANGKDTAATADNIVVMTAKKTPIAIPEPKGEPDISVLAPAATTEDSTAAAAATTPAMIVAAATAVIQTTPEKPVAAQPVAMDRGPATPASTDTPILDDDNTAAGALPTLAAAPEKSLPIEAKPTATPLTPAAKEAFDDLIAQAQGKPQTSAAPATATTASNGPAPAGAPVHTATPATAPVTAVITPAMAANTAATHQGGENAATGKAAGISLQAATGTEATAKAQLPYENSAKALKAKALSQPALIEQVAVQINRAAKNGDKSFNIQLHPAELGRIEVKLDVSQDGQTRATVTADNKDTLVILQKDRTTLERALTDAGLQLDSSSLSFNLREGGQQNAGGFNQGSNAKNGQNGTRLASADETPSVINLIVNADKVDGRVDIRA